jgi:putative ABC transport system substrate-binding protein
MLTIAVDAMGGDHAPKAEVAGAVDAARNLGVRVILVGQETAVREHLAGYKDWRDLPIEIHHASEQITAAAATKSGLIAEFSSGGPAPVSLRLKPDVIMAENTAGALAAKQATASIPIVAAILTDPVGMRLVASEARPGTNVTGILNRVEGLAGKQSEIALDLLPGVRKIGVLVNLNNPTNALQRRESEAAAAKLSVSFVPVDVRTADEVGPAFQTFVRERANIVVVLGDAMFVTMRRQIAAVALAARLPTVFSVRDHVEDGGLISYGVSLRENYRRVAYYVNRILKGETPADLPVEFPTKIELVLNLATAKALGLTIPPSIMFRVDEVIE